MPQSKSRHGHKHAGPHPHIQQHSKPEKSNRIIVIATLFCALLGLGIGFFIEADNFTTLLLSTVVGGIAGLVFGYQVRKSF